VRRDNFVVDAIENLNRARAAGDGENGLYLWLINGVVEIFQAVLGGRR
jgi:hypothetical protein